MGLCVGMKGEFRWKGRKNEFLKNKKIFKIKLSFLNTILKQLTRPKLKPSCRSFNAGPYTFHACVSWGLVRAYVKSSSNYGTK